MLVRSGAHVVPLSIAGVPIQYLSSVVRKLPRSAQEFVVRQVGKITERRRGAPVLPRPAHSPLDSIPVIGFHLVDAIREGLATLQLGGIARLTADGATFTDGTSAPFDAIILATGFEPALGMLGSLVTRDARGFASRRDRVTSADQPGLYFVGHNYDATGGIANIARDSRAGGGAHLRLPGRGRPHGTASAPGPSARRCRTSDESGARAGAVRSRRLPVALRDVARRVTPARPPR